MIKDEDLCYYEDISRDIDAFSAYDHEHWVEIIQDLVAEIRSLKEKSGNDFG